MSIEVHEPEEQTRAVEHHGSPGHLEVAAGQSQWTDDQRAALKQLGLADATDADLKVFMHQAQRTGLDPFSRQIYMISRWDSQSNGYKYTIQTGIDGFRVIANRHPQYGGQVGPQWCGPDGVWLDVWVSDRPPAAARVGIIRKDWDEPVWGVAMFREYAQTKKNGEFTQMWATKGAVMIAKCFDEQTEVLTEFGYRRFADVGDARIMQVTAGGLEAVAAKPFVQDYDGLMVTLDSDDLNFSVTPNHDMVTTVGKVEAGAMYATSRSRPTWLIPRIAPAAEGPGLDLDLDRIRLAAIIVADGTGTSRSPWTVEVSRPAKIAALDALGLERERYVRGTRGDEATSRRSGRVVKSNFDKQGYRYPAELVSALVDADKRLRVDALRAMNSQQARTLVDTLIEFDGYTNRKTGVRRFYTSDNATRGAFELAAAIAGYTTNTPRERFSDLSDRPNWCITVSDRDAIGFIRSGDARTGLELTPNASGRVWCVTVPSGQIMVRRNGFAMICGNCAEALGFRKAFPFDLSGMYTDDEMGNASEPGAARRRSGRVAAQSSVSAAELRGTAIDVTAQPEAMTADQAKRIGDAFKAAGVSDRAARARIVDSLTDRPISGPADLSHDEAASLIAELEDMGPEDIAALADVPQQTQVEWPEVNGPAGDDQ